MLCTGAFQYFAISSLLSKILIMNVKQTSKTNVETMWLFLNNVSCICVLVKPCLMVGYNYPCCLSRNVTYEARKIHCLDFLRNDVFVNADQNQYTTDGIIINQPDYLRTSTCYASLFFQQNKKYVLYDA